MSVFRKAAVFLGLVDDDVDAYPGDEGYLVEEGFDEGVDDGYEDQVTSRRPRPAPVTDRAERSERPDRAERVDSSGGVTVMRVPRPEGAAPAGGPTLVPRTAGTAGPTVRTVPGAANRVHILDPVSFDDAQEVGDRLKSGQPVILNLQGADRELARRLIDFSSGLCYATNGSLSKVADQVFLLTPANVEVPEDEVRRLSARGLYHAR